ncbi:MAG: hypothetical protein ACPG5B_09610 [Chitinophagales bacterium]
MAKFVFWCYRQPITATNNLEAKTKKIAENIIPQNIKAISNYEIVKNKHSFLAIFNNNGHFEQQDDSICIGKTFGKVPNWWKIGTEKPDGNYVLIRNNEDKQQVEILNDILGTRAAWFVKTDDFFMLSSSQRAIVMCLKSFERNNETIAYMLSAGCLGPYLSWDKRIKLLPPDSTLFLDIKNWKLDIHTERCVFLSEKKSKKKHILALQKSIEQTYNEIDIDAKKWQLLLSGGFDSRANYLFLKNKKDLNYLTWGRVQQENKTEDDIYISKKIASYYNLPLKIVVLENKTLNFQKVLKNYIINSEVRTDHIPAFLHNFETWQNFYQQKIIGAIRGDEGFGWLPVYTDFDVRRSTSFDLLSDFFTAEKMEYFQLPPQHFSEKWQQTKQESRSQWRDRLYHTFRMPIVLSALSDTVLMYGDILNPLLSRKIIKQVRTMPDNLRTNKKAFRLIMQNISPPIAYAKKASWASLEDVAQHEKIQQIVKQKLHTNIATRVFNENWINFLLENIKTKEQEVQKKSFKQQIITKIAQNLPQYMKSMLRLRLLKPKISANLFAFRTYLVLEMCELLEKDAQKI